MKHSFLTIAYVILFAVGCTNGKKENVDHAGYDKYDPSDPSVNQSGKQRKTHTVEIKQMKFEPPVLYVKKGDEVMFINRDIVDHDVTEQNTKAWTSSKLAMGASWRTVATKSELYYCSIHVVMKGKIVVDGANIAKTSNEKYFYNQWLTKLSSYFSGNKSEAQKTISSASVQEITMCK